VAVNAWSASPTKFQLTIGALRAIPERERKKVNAIDAENMVKKSEGKKGRSENET
jgi:hypothetical protein